MQNNLQNYQNQNQKQYLPAQSAQTTGGVPQQNATAACASQQQGGQAAAPKQGQALQQKQLSQAPASHVTEPMKQIYEQIFNSYGADAANNWIKQQIVGTHVNVQMDNAAVLKEIQGKYADLTSVPAVQAAIQDYIRMASGQFQS